MRRRTFLATTPAGGMLPGRAAHAAEPADVLLVLALDGSGSMSNERITMQRTGHAQAVASDAFIAAVLAGPKGRVALAAVEWSNQDRQTVIVPWTVIGDAESAQRFAEALRRAPRPIPGITSISGAIDACVAVLARAPCEATRRVIDISSNGVNNDGRPVTDARDQAVAQGITINGLPILDLDPTLDAYFVQSVIGGPRAFTVPASDIDSFAEALQRKLVTEIAARPVMRG